MKNAMKLLLGLLLVGVLNSCRSHEKCAAYENVDVLVHTDAKK